MKKFIKNYFMAIVAVMMVVGFSAFKIVEKQSNFTKTPTSVQDEEIVLWRFNSTDPSKVTTPDQYVEKPNNPPPCDEGDDIICEIEAPKDPDTGEPMLNEVHPTDPLGRTYAQLIDQAMLDGNTNSVVKEFKGI